MAPNLSEEQQVIIVINFFGANTPKGLHICYVPTAYIDMCCKKWNQKRVSAQNEVKILFEPSFWILFFTRSFNHQNSRISYIALCGGVFFFHFMLVFQGLVLATKSKWVSDFKYIWETKTCDPPVWSSFSENSQLTIFTTKYGGDPFDDVPLLCTLCALSMFFEISSLEVSDKTLDIWFIKTDLVLDQELWSACWCLIFLNIKVFLRDLFFSSSISLSNSLIVSNFLLMFSLCSFISNFKLCLITVIANISFGVFFSICSILMHISLAMVSNFYSIEISSLVKSSNFPLSSTLFSSKLSLYCC